MEKIYGFSPIIDTDSQVLILGSMPSVKSLRDAEYYAHPQNRFWKIIFDLTGEKCTTDYAEKKRILLSHGIALWDSIGACVRNGSMDGAIKDVEPNDVRGLLEKYSGIKAVFVNGKKSESVYKKYNEGSKYLYLPSTSPANAAYSYDDLYRIWSDALKRFIK